MEFQIWHYWVIAAFFFFVLEVFIPGFIMGSIGLGCLLAMFGALVNLPLWVNVILFIIGFLIGIVMLKPMLKKWEKTADVKTNADGLIGRIGKVCETIDPEAGTGRVHVDGDDWRALSSENLKIDVGTNVEIIALESIVVTVRPLIQRKNNEAVTLQENPIADTLKNKLGLIVSLGNKKEVVHFEDIKCIFSSQKITYLLTSTGKQMVLDDSLEKLEERLDPQRFFRANRQFIITSTIVKEFRSKNDGKLEITLESLSNLPQSISVSRLKSHAFRKWMKKQV